MGCQGDIPAGSSGGPERAPPSSCFRRRHGRAPQRAQQSFEVQAGPDAGYSGVNPQRMMEFFIENLVINTLAPGAAITTTN